MRFIDTNILLYFVSGDPADSSKQATAAELLDQEDLCLSVQVLQEFYVQATRPTRADRLNHEEALDLIASWKRYPIQEITLDLMEQALARLATELEQARLERCRVLTLIHGYGSSGRGGKIGGEVRAQLQYLKLKGAINDLLIGEDFSSRTGVGRQIQRRFPFLRQHSDLNRGNRGITLVVI